MFQAISLTDLSNQFKIEFASGRKIPSDEVLMPKHLEGYCIDRRSVALVSHDRYVGIAYGR